MYQLISSLRSCVADPKAQLPLAPTSAQTLAHMQRLLHALHIVARFLKNAAVFAIVLAVVILPAIGDAFVRAIAQLLHAFRLNIHTRSGRRRILVVAGVTLAALTTPLVPLYMLSRATPDWWQRPAAATLLIQAKGPTKSSSLGTAANFPASWSQRAAEVENAVLAQLSLVRMGSRDRDGVWRSDPWSVSISEEDASAWLATRLPRWIASREGDDAWPSQVAQIRVSFRDGSIVAGALLVGGAASSQVLGVETRPEVDANGALLTPATRVRVGRVSLPASWLVDTVRARASDFVPAETLATPVAQAAMRALMGQGPLTRDAVIRLDDGRRVRILKLAPRDGRLDMTFQTERR